VLRMKLTQEKHIGNLEYAAGLIPKNESISARELAQVFSWQRLSGDSIYLDSSTLT